MLAVHMLLLMCVLCVKQWRVCVKDTKNDSAQLVLEGWGLWLRFASAGALLYKAQAYRRLQISDGVSFRSDFNISPLTVYSLGKCVCRLLFLNYLIFNKMSLNSYF